MGRHTLPQGDSFCSICWTTRNARMVSWANGMRNLRSADYDSHISESRGIMSSSSQLDEVGGNRQG